MSAALASGWTLGCLMVGWAIALDLPLWVTVLVSAGVMVGADLLCRHLFQRMLDQHDLRLLTARDRLVRRWTGGAGL